MSDDIFNEYTNPPEGKVRIVKAGYPAWADIPPLSNEELSAAADVKRPIYVFGQTQRLTGVRTLLMRD